jgi:hypothetical protein
MWHIGTADTMFTAESVKHIVWDTEEGTYGFKSSIDDDDEDDSDWLLPDCELECSSLEYNDTDIEYDSTQEYDSEDVSWCASAATMLTWECCDEVNTMVSKRVKYQQQPVIR